jgi:hypothetical protein
MTRATKCAYDKKHFHICRIESIEILRLNLNDEYEISTLSTVLKSNSLKVYKLKGRVFHFMKI